MPSLGLVARWTTRCTVLFETCASRRSVNVLHSSAAAQSPEEAVGTLPVILMDPMLPDAPRLRGSALARCRLCGAEGGAVPPPQAPPVVRVALRVLRRVRHFFQTDSCAIPAMHLLPVWTVRSCRACGNACTWPAPASVDYAAADFHASVAGQARPCQPVSLEQLPSQWRHSLLQQADLLARHVPVGGTILEIGCGQGMLLAELQRRGFNVVGIEPSVSAAEEARRRGLDVVTGYFPDVSVAGPIDAVVLCHVLEHLPSPVETVRRIAAIAPSGRLLLVQSNYRALMPRLLGPNWYAWAADQHYWHFVPRGLLNLVRPYGLEVETCEYSSLVHHGVLARGVALVGRMIPPALDQFHLLLRLP